MLELGVCQGAITRCKILIYTTLAVQSAQVSVRLNYYYFMIKIASINLPLVLHILILTISSSMFKLKKKIPIWMPTNCKSWQIGFIISL